MPADCTESVSTHQALAVSSCTGRRSTHRHSPSHARRWHSHATRRSWRAHSRRRSTHSWRSSHAHAWWRWSHARWRRRPASIANWSPLCLSRQSISARHRQHSKSPGVASCLGRDHQHHAQGLNDTGVNGTHTQTHRHTRKSSLRSRHWSCRESTSCCTSHTRPSSHLAFFLHGPQALVSISRKRWSARAMHLLWRRALH